MHVTVFEGQGIRAIDVASDGHQLAAGFNRAFRQLFDHFAPDLVVTTGNAEALVGTRQRRGAVDRVPCQQVDQVQSGLVFRLNAVFGNQVGLEYLAHIRVGTDTHLVHPGIGIDVVQCLVGVIVPIVGRQPRRLLLNFLENLVHVAPLFIQLVLGVMLAIYVIQLVAAGHRIAVHVFHVQAKLIGQVAHCIVFGGNQLSTALNRTAENAAVGIYPAAQAGVAFKDGAGNAVLLQAVGTADARNTTTDNRYPAGATIAVTATRIGLGRLGYTTERSAHTHRGCTQPQLLQELAALIVGRSLATEARAFGNDVETFVCGNSGFVR